MVQKILRTIFHISIPFIIALYTYYTFSLFGFPDGHLTEYELALRVPYMIFILMDMITAIYVLYKSVRGSTHQTISLYIIMYLFIRICITIGTQWYLKDYLLLDSGYGA